MSEFFDMEASEGEDEDELTARDKKKLKKMNKNRLQDSSEEEEGKRLTMLCNMFYNHFRLKQRYE